MDWYFVALSLLVPHPLLGGIITYLVEHREMSPKRYPPDRIEPDERHVIDYPGMISTTRNLHTFTLDGLSFFIPSTDFVRAFNEIRNLPLCHEGGLPHYRFYGSVRVLCMTPPQRDTLIKEMGNQLSHAIEIADWENRQLNAAFGGSEVDACIITGGREVRTKIMKGPATKNLIYCPRPVIDRDIEEV